MSEVVPRDQRFGPSGHECEQRLGLLATFEDSMTFAPYEANEPLLDFILLHSNIRVTAVYRH